MRISGDLIFVSCSLGFSEFLYGSFAMIYWVINPRNDRANAPAGYASLLELGRKVEVDLSALPADVEEYIRRAPRADRWGQCEPHSWSPLIKQRLSCRDESSTAMWCGWSGHSALGYRRARSQLQSPVQYERAA